MEIFLTGGTGFLGQAILERLAESASYDRIHILIRPDVYHTPQQRLNKLIVKIFGPERAVELNHKLIAVPGDLTKEGLGIAASVRLALSKSVRQILHIAANTDLSAALDVSRSINVSGTKLVLDFADECRRNGLFKRFDYISTAFVGGTKSGELFEEDLERGQDFSNHYERTKFEAEILVRQHMHKFSVTLYRPSIIVGDSRTGCTTHFKVLYWPLRILSRNWVPFISVNKQGNLDVVPVNYVADAITAIMNCVKSQGQTYHLTAGPGHEVKIGSLLEDAYQYINIKKRPNIPLWLFNFIRYSPIRRLFRPEMWYVVDISDPYIKYLRGSAFTLNNHRTLEVLEKLGVSLPLWNTYKHQILSFCKDSHWGKKSSKGCR